MSEKSNNKEFFELLLLNDESKLKEFIYSYGKEPKSICPVRFHKENEKDEVSE